MWGVLLKPKSCSLLLYCQRAAVPRCQVLLQRPMLPCANPALAQKPSAQRMLASSASSSSSAPSADQKQGISREEYNQRQRSVFSSPNLTQIFAQEVEEDVQQRLRTIVNSVPELGESSRVVDVGSGTGCLVPHMQARGVQDILAVDLSAAMLEVLQKKYGASQSTLGNDAGVRTWAGDILDLPNYLGWGADAFHFNGVFGNIHDPRAALLHASLQAKPGGHIVISHPMGRAWHCQLAASQPDITPHTLPSRHELDEMLKGLPLRVVDFTDAQDLYLAVLQVPPHYEFPGAPVLMSGPVVEGFGRGSKQMGVPTANIDPKPLETTLKAMHNGVYFGWVKVDAPPSLGFAPADSGVHKMVMNIGNRPTVNKGDEEPSVEVHTLHKFARDFYGQNIHVAVVGFIRPEMRFSKGFPELLNRIKLDISTARTQLDLCGHEAAELLKH
eukprot:CAMPEP_0202375320 /NCGR_PEP_ID=MMETSP1127-20130417/6009_1 /ASSEMBLY_ACC=CAM_ASM_000462 /TAXON_ID=3047 /ORGANISM="Dunaliella tertiolecta, Strain CCMP1320" /LENGTH=442 /DNA_ID=CAMNT_0048972759 /DNA_START=83 /DNA_END=1411 /DNA_ORIENTATION=+